MGQIHEMRVNKMYDHQNSVAERQPKPALTPVGELRVKQVEEDTRTRQRFNQEARELDNKHNEQHKSNILTRNGGRVPDQVLEQDRIERQDLRHSHDRQMSGLRSRQARELAEAIEKHGATP